MQIEFNTDQFVFSHGRQPKGYGGWAFGTKRNPDTMNSDECWFTPGAMTYGEAKKWAKAEAKRRFLEATHVTLYVLS